MCKSIAWCIVGIAGALIAFVSGCWVTFYCLGLCNNSTDRWMSTPIIMTNWAFMGCLAVIVLYFGESLMIIHFENEEKLNKS